ncbi:hypothetical protein SLEP1_g32403 [Rubroshorea leprosula]|uniref:Retrotransposon gag domain-containing protein n=1 Tax=Rubroshorea leprosula TaxID=152421 RepID=A0AAV5KD76_9ROSI|nr:hypothetical protein SLEP1_g32403 [Rubroshorea leprosula]
MVRTFTRGRPPRNETGEQEDAQLSEPGLNDSRPMPRNFFVGGAEQDHLSETDDDERTPTGYATQPEQFQVPTETRQRPSRPYNSQHERPERSTEPAQTTELEERTRILETTMGKILARLIPDDPLIPLLNRDAQPAAVVATRNSPALSNIVVPTRPRGSVKLNIEPSLSKHSEELMRKNADLERQLWDGFKIPHLETYDGLGDPDEHLHTYQAIMRIQNANDAMMCKVFPTTLKSTARRWEIKRTATELMQVHQKEGESLRDYMQRFNKATLDIDNVPDTICLSALLHGLKHGRFLDDLLKNPSKTWNEVNDRSASFILSEDFQSSKRGRGTNLAGHKMYIRITSILLSRAGRTEDVRSTGEDRDKELPPRTKKIGKGWCTLGRPKRPRSQSVCKADYKRAEGEPGVMMPHSDPFVAMVHIGNHNVNKVFIDTGSSLDILYWSCFQKMQLNPSLLQKHEGPIYGMASVTFLVVKMESAFNAILGRATLRELKAVISQPHLCMKFLTTQGVGVLKGNQKMARACYQDTFKKVELTAASVSSENHRPTQPGQQTMSISDIEHRPEGVKQKAKPVETVPVNPDVPERTINIGTRLIEEERTELLEFLRVNQDVFAWTTDEMPSIPAELTVHKLSTDPTRKLVAGFIRRVEYSEWVSNPVLVKKPNSKWRMCIDFTNLNEVCPKDPHPLPNVEKLVERAAGHERMSFLDASSGYHQVQLLLDDHIYQVVTRVAAHDRSQTFSQINGYLRSTSSPLFMPPFSSATIEVGCELSRCMSALGAINTPQLSPRKIRNLYASLSTITPVSLSRTLSIANLSVGVLFPRKHPRDFQV